MTLKKITHSLLATPVNRLLKNFNLRVYPFTSSRESRTERLLKSQNIDLVIDCGANIGQYGKWLRNLGFKNNILSLEPLSDAYGKLTKHSAKDAKWDIMQCGLGDEDNKREINVSKNSVSSSFLERTELLSQAEPNTTYIRQEEVVIKKLDTILPSITQNKKLSIFLKIDAQGYEKKILEGAKDALKYIKICQIETAVKPTYIGGSHLVELVDLMSEKGFELVGIEPNFMDKKTGKLIEADCLFERIN